MAQRPTDSQLLQKHQVNAILLYDGVCVLCNSFVKWLVKHDKEGYYHYATITDSGEKERIEQLGVTGDTVVLLEGGHIYTYSDVALQVCKRLSLGYRLLGQLARLLPVGFRDAVYRWIAANRYRWFGKHPSCPLPTGDLRQRLISDL